MYELCPVPQITPITRDNFQPISLLKVVSKLMRKVALRRNLKEFVDYDPTQFAYRSLSSTVCALVHFHDVILKYLEMPEVAVL